MTFLCDGRVYAAAGMRLFRTHDPEVPSIYLTRDGRAVFVVRCQPDGTLSSHRAGTAELIALSRRHGIAGLLGAFPASFAPAEIIPGECPEDGSPPAFRDVLHPRGSGTERAKAMV
jgi:hypothetical protein